MRRMFSEKQLENQTIELLGEGNVPSIKADSIIQNMEGYSLSAIPSTNENDEITNIYYGVCQNGNKLTFVCFLGVERLNDEEQHVLSITFTIPSSVGAKLFPYNIAGADYLDNRTIEATQSTDWTRKTLNLDVIKNSNTSITFAISDYPLTKNIKTYVRIEQTFLLSDNLIG